MLRETPSPTRGPACPEPPLKPDALELKANWRYEEDGARWHYLVEARVARRRCGRAYGWYEPGGRFVLEKIELDPAQRSRGYGSSLIETLRAKARELGCSELVFQGVMASNAGAIRLYESLGATAVPTAEGMFAFVLSPP